MMQAVENRMVQGAYYEDDPREYILDTAKPEAYTKYVYDKNLVREVLSKWQGVALTPAGADEMWDGLRDELLDSICQGWVEKNALDDFVECEKERLYGSV